MLKYLVLFFITFLTVLLANSQVQNGVCFSAVSNYSVAFAPNAIVSGDFNNDGIPDLATANAGTNNVSVMLGTGTGSFSPAVTFPAANGLYAMTIADFNADGNLDLAVVNGGGYRLLLGTGTGSFAFPIGSGMAWAPVDIVAADFNGDGLPDIAVINTYQNYNVGVKLNTGNGNFGPEVTYSCLGGQKITTGDFNGDGKVDLAVGRGGQSSQYDFSVLYGTGTGSFNNAVHYAQLGLYISAITAADFNGDGRSDIAMASWNSNVVSVRLATGTGSFAAGTTYAIGTFPKAIVSADFNGDGKLDLATANYNTNNISVLYQNSNGTYGTAVSYPLGAAPTGLTASDFDGDGRPDLAASVDYYSAAVLLNTTPGITVSASSNTFCAGGTATLNVSGASSYTWAGGPNTNSYVVTPGVTTTYSVSGSSSGGCIAGPAALKITVKPLPAVAVQSNSFVCIGDSTAAFASGASTYTWNTGAQTPLISFIAGSTSAFSVTGTSTVTGCSATATLQLNVSDCTGLKKNQTSKHQVIIFPNPAREKIKLRFEDPQQSDVQVEILNAVGQVLSVHILSPGSSVIDVAVLAQGLYFLRLNDQVQKFVKE